MDIRPNQRADGVETYEFPHTNGRYVLEFDRREAMPPDDVSAIQGLVCAHTLQLTELATDIYGLESRQSWRVLDLGCGVGTFLVGTLAGSEDLPVELVGLDNDPGVLDYAERNITKATSVSRAKYPERRISHLLLRESWSALDLWERLGDFDYIFLNPPYLRQGDLIREQGYEHVPPQQILADNPDDTYRQLWQPCFEHLRLGGMLVFRGSSRRVFKLPVRQFMEGIQGQIEHTGSFQPYSPERTGYVERFVKLPDDWPLNRTSPYGDPRLRILLSTGQDIGTL